MNRFFIVITIVLSQAACKKAELSTNKFSDPVLVKIADLQDRRASDSLYLYFSHENPAYRAAAVLAFASIQDSSAIEKISVLVLADNDTTVRKTSAFALGQIPSSKSENVLSDASASEKVPNVLREILEAYGKVTKKWNLDYKVIGNREGLAWSLYRSGLNNAVDSSVNIFAATLLDKGESEMTRLGGANFFARGAKHIENVQSAIINSAINDPSTEVRLATTLALRKIINDSSFMALEKIIQRDDDYRIRVNALRSLQAFPFEKSKDYLLKSITDRNVNVGIAASEGVLASVTENFWIELANRVTDIRHWRIQANIYEAILKVKENQTVIDEIKTAYKQSINPYQKAALLTSLQQSAGSIDFIEQELMKADTPIIRSSAAAAIVFFNRSKKFRPALKIRFVEIFKKAMQTGDPAVIGITASALADSSLGYRDIVKDFSFLKEAKQKLSLPKDNEALQPLESAIAYFERRKIEQEVKNEFNHPIDWEVVKSLSKAQLAVIKTTKGNITLRLLIEEAPGSVANFVKLAQQNYFNNKLFHRVVPNFVVQAGCNRGDGWGSEDYSIRSEFSQRRYTTGSVGMASAGKDTEGTQWFITHSPTPHLDGRYSIFAVVQRGIEAVHLMEVGDRIIEIEIQGEEE